MPKSEKKVAKEIPHSERMEVKLWAALIKELKDRQMLPPLRPLRLTIGGVSELASQPPYHVPTRSFLDWGAGPRQKISAYSFGIPARLSLSHFKLSQVLRRSSLGADIYVVDGWKSPDIRSLSEVFSMGAFWSTHSESPGNAESFEFYAQFLDGGLAQFSGDHFVGLKGTWLHGMNAVRLMCYQIGLRQPPKRDFESRVPSESELLQKLIAERVDPSFLPSFMKILGRA